MDKPDPDKVFRTREEAEHARDRLNLEPPEWGFSPWYLGGPVGEDGEWWVIRARVVIAEDLDMDAREYEEQYRAEAERIMLGPLDPNGITIERIDLQGSYPKTQLVFLLRVRKREECQFGLRWPVWPAESGNPKYDAGELSVYFTESVGTDRESFERLFREPCDPTSITWLGSE